MGNTINIQCVHGNGEIEHIRRCIIPNLPAATALEINFLALNYESDGHADQLRDEDLDRVHVRNIPAARSHAGFAENHNHIFNSFPSGDSFVLMNPDCIPLPGSIDRLLARKSPDVAIVEGRQWPFEHPKEYDPRSLETPWASFAFCLMDSAFYAGAGGMDELYFMYCEDVDLSWQAWLTGHRVLYEPLAQIMHFTGSHFSRRDYVSAEMYYSARNFLLISRKFFGKAGEEKALTLMRANLDEDLLMTVLEDYRANVAPKIDDRWAGKRHDKVRIHGFNTFAAPRT